MLVKWQNQEFGSGTLAALCAEGVPLPPWGGDFTKKNKQISKNKIKDIKQLYKDGADAVELAAVGIAYAVVLVAASASAVALAVPARFNLPVELMISGALTAAFPLAVAAAMREAA